MNLTLEQNANHQPGGIIAGGAVMMTPKIDEDYWAFRVKLNDDGQAILGFAKFGTVGIGFAQEQDWNTNLPYRSETDEILLWIWHNRGPVTDSLLVRQAISMVQEAAYATLGGERGFHAGWRVRELLIPGSDEQNRWKAEMAEMDGEDN